MQKLHNDPHPVELLALAGMVLLWAAWQVLRLLLVPLLAPLLVLLTPRRRPAPQAPTPPAAAPEPPALEAPAAAAEPVAVPCLADLATGLMELPATQLRAMAGTRRRLPKRELTALICAMPI